jgi:hypothetical protein
MIGSVAAAMMAKRRMGAPGFVPQRQQELLKCCSSVVVILIFTVPVFLPFQKKDDRIIDVLPPF